MVSFKAFTALFMVRLFGALPLWASQSIGRILGSLAYHLNTRMAQVTRTNISLCLPEYTNPKQLTLHSLQATGMLAAEICHCFTRNTQATDYIIAIEGEDIAKEALAAGKGLVLLAPHLGNWEILGMHLTQLAPVTNLYQPPKITGLDPLIRKARERSGAHLVPTTAKGVSALLKALKAGGICGILPDQNPNERKSGEFAPFFGHPAFTMVLAHKLLKKTGAKAVFAFAQRVPGGFKLIYRKPPEDIYSTEQEVSLKALNEGVESLVKEAPEQYQWEYKRFKVKPEGANSIY